MLEYAYLSGSKKEALITTKYICMKLEYTDFFLESPKNDK